MTITPRFEADIGADISKFMQKASEVDAKIREMATGVVIDITAQIQDFMSDANKVQDTINDIDRTVDVTVNGNITDLERAIAEANAQIAALNDSATVNINGNNSNFNNSAGSVNSTTRNLRRRVTEARIGANIGDFENRMVRVTQALTEADGTVTPRIQLDINEFQSEILTVEDRMRELARATADPEVEADIAGFMAQMSLVQTQLNSVAQIHDIDIRADTGSAHARLTALWLQIRSLTAKNFIVGVTTRWTNFQNTMGNIANFTRSMAEVGGTIGRGALITIAPAVVPILGSVVHLLGNLGPMLGTVAGSTFAFATSLGAAGLGVAGFAAVAVPTIKDLFALDEAVGRGTSAWYALSQETRTAMNAIDEFQGNWGTFREEMDKPVTTAFTDFMQVSNKLLNLFKPAIEGSVTAVGNLMKSLEAAVEGTQVKSFFEWLGTSAGQHLETLGTGLGNFLLGFMNMMTAFGPLAETTAAGFARMGEGFAQWSAGLSENQGFQKFVDYVNENMPKIRSIFSDAIQGIISLFAEFGPSSSDMMSSLQDSMAKFKEWSAALSENQGFQKFMDYIKTNSPVVVDLIGEIITFVKNLAVAMAPMGEKMLAAGKAIFEWANGLLEAHPWLGKVAVGVGVFAGAFTALLPIIVGVNALLGGFITKMILFTARMVATSVVVAAKWLWMGVQSLIGAARMAAAWLIALGPIGWVIATVIALAVLIIANWDTIKAKTIEIFTKVKDWVIEKFIEIANRVMSAVSLFKTRVLMKWIEIKTTTLKTIDALKEKAITYFVDLANRIIGKILLLQNQAEAKWIQLKTNTLRTVDELKTKVIDFFTKIKDKITEKMTDAVNTVKEKVGEMPGKVSGFVSKMVSAGGDLIQGLIDGAIGMAGDAISSIKSIAGDMVDAALSFFKIKSPSRVFMEMGAYVSEGLAVGVEDKARSAISSVQSMAAGMTTAFNPRMELADMRASAQLDTSVSRADMGVVRHAFAAEVGEVEKHEPDLYLVVDGKELGKVVAKPVQEENERRGEMVRVGRGR